MNKKEFLSLGKNLRLDIRHNIDEERSRIRKELRDVRAEIDSKAVELAKELVAAGKVDLNQPERVEVAFNYYTNTPDGVIVYINYDFTQHEEIKALLEKYKKLKEELEKNNKMSWKWRSIFESWRLAALESGKYNKEPFPKELLPYVSDNYKKLLVIEDGS